MAIAVPVAATALSVASFGKPVVDEINRITPITTVTAWTTPTFTNNWVNAGGSQAAQFRKIGDVVYLRGAISNGTMATSAFTMPAGFRPPAETYFSTGSWTGTAWVIARLRALADGTMIPQDGTNLYFNLSGFSYSVTP